MQSFMVWVHLRGSAVADSVSIAFDKEIVILGLMLNREILFSSGQHKNQAFSFY